MGTGTEASQTRRRSRVHWHPFWVHFPVALFGTSFLFQLLHLFWYPDCFELATNVTLLFGAAAMLPAVGSGWMSWKRGYRGARGGVFSRKIAIGFAMLGTSMALVAWRLLAGEFVHNLPHLGHVVYFTFITLLMLGAALEGYYGGKLIRRR